jgi:Phage late-transcription coactivator
MPTKDEITTFSLAIETLAKNKDVPYMDAVIMYCSEIGLEVEVAAKLISGALKSKIKIEAEDLHFLPKSNTVKLPF